LAELFQYQFLFVDCYTHSAIYFHINKIETNWNRLFTGGFSAIGAELIIIFAFQFIFGNVYYMLSIIITAFMAGIAYGVFALKKSDSLKKFISSQLLLTVYVLSYLWHYCLLSKYQKII